MDDGREDIEFCLENYRFMQSFSFHLYQSNDEFRTLIYNGNFDIICDHSGILDMINDLNWSGLDKYK